MGLNPLEKAALNSKTLEYRQVDRRSLIGMLREDYADEKEAANYYTALAEQARAEGHPDIAETLENMGKQEQEHMMRIGRILEELGEIL